LFSSHSLLPVSKLCLVHSKELQYLCEQCPILLCATCVRTRTKCSSHEEKIKLVSQVMPTARNELRTIIGSLHENHYSYWGKYVSSALKEVHKQKTDVNKTILEVDSRIQSHEMGGHPMQCNHWLCEKCATSIMAKSKKKCTGCRKKKKLQLKKYQLYLVSQRKSLYDQLDARSVELQKLETNLMLGKSKSEELLSKASTADQSADPESLVLTLAWLKLSLPSIPATPDLAALHTNIAFKPHLAFGVGELVKEKSGYKCDNTRIDKGYKDKEKWYILNRDEPSDDDDDDDYDDSSSEDERWADFTISYCTIKELPDEAHCETCGRWDHGIDVECPSLQNAPACNYCSSTEHDENECPTLLQLHCYSCGKSGHDDEDCPRLHGGKRTLQHSGDKFRGCST